MAKWGEGDPRWLVEDRPDATNVNNWHWTEKNASQWSKNKLTDLLVGLKGEDEIGTFEITEMSKCEGDAAVNNRKAKLFFFYEWAIELKWKGVPRGDDDSVTGNFEILNLSEEHNIKDVDVIVGVDKSGPTNEKFKEIMRTKGSKMVKQQLEIYLNSLKEEFSRGVILPTKESTNVYPELVNNRGVSKEKNGSEKKPNITANKKVEVAEFQTTVSFKCTAEEFYRIFTTKETVRAFTQSECTLNAVAGGTFELYGGNVQGRFVELIPGKLIKQKWRFKSWPKDHFSDVKIEIKEKTDCTEIFVDQKGIPKSELENTTVGWNRYYWESMKRVFGLGAILF